MWRSGPVAQWRIGLDPDPASRAAYLAVLRLFVDGSVAYEIGNYNALMANCPAYKKCNDRLFQNLIPVLTLAVGELNFEESHELFRGAFLDGFPWEVLKVLSGPPNVLFTWRHWGVHNAKFQENIGHGEQLEMYGVAKCGVTEDLKIQRRGRRRSARPSR